MTGSNVVGDTATTVVAGRDITLEAAKTTHQSSSYSQTSESGLMSSGGIGFTLGSRDQSLDQNGQGTGATASTVGTVSGNTTLVAGNTYTQKGSDVVAPGGDVNILAKDIAITEVQTTNASQTEQKFSQSGLTVALSNPVINALQSAQSITQTAGQTKSGRMQTLAAASAALTGYNAYKGLVDAKGAIDPTKASSVGITISLDSQSSQSTTDSHASNAQSSNITAGHDINLVASGAGADSKLLIQGSNIAAAHNTRLSAEGQIALLAAQNTASDHSTNQSAGASVGVSFTVGSKSGFSLELGVNKAQGFGDGDGVSYTNTHVNAGNAVSLTSGGDTTLKGAVIAANTVVADVGKSLNIQSLQDSSTYEGKQESASVGLSLCLPPFCFGTSSASASLASAQAKGNFKSVSEQSAIRAGDGGFAVNVQGDTTLQGGAITSTDKAVSEGKNSFNTAGKLSLSDLSNHDQYDASGYQVGASLSAGNPMDKDGKPVLDKNKNNDNDNVKQYTPGGSAGYGQAEGSQASTTQAAISGIAGNKDARTGDASTALNQNWSGQQLLGDVQAQAAITAAFGSAASKAVGDYATSQFQKLTTQAATEADPTKRQALTDEAAKWDEGGSYRSLAHAAIGGLTGGVQGALGAGAAAYSADALNKLTADLPDGVRQAVGAAIATGIGAAAGGTAGAAAAFNSDLNNRQLHPNERVLAAKLAAKSKGKYTTKQIEDAMRNSGNVALGESVVTAMLINDPSKAGAIYDKGAVFQTGDGKSLFQVPPNGGNVDPSLAAYIAANTGGGNSPYGWQDNQLGKTASAPTPTNDNPFGPNWSYMGLSSAGVASGVKTENRSQAQIDASLRQTTYLIAAAPVWVPVVGWAATASPMGFALGVGGDAAGQYYQTGEVRPVQSIFSGVTGAIAMPLSAGLPGAALSTRGAVGIVGNAASGGTTAVVNTAFNNWYYGEDTSLFEAGRLGTTAGGAGAVFGSWATRLAPSLFPNLIPSIPYIPAAGPVAPFPASGTLNLLPAKIGNAVSNTIGAIPSFISLDNGVGTPAKKGEVKK